MSDTATTTPTKKGWRITRRGFLIGLGATGVGLAVGVAVGRRPFYRFMAGILSEASPPGSLSTEPSVWFEITPANQVRLFVSKAEMGQGIHTAIAQIGAEELGIRWEQLEVVQGNTHRGPSDSNGTGGSNSVSSVYTPLRQAAAMLRQMLILKAAEKLALPAGELETKEGTVRAKANPSQSLTFGEIVEGVTEWPEVDVETITLKDPSQFEFIGQSMPRVDFKAKLTGQATYGYDVRVPGMLYGAIARPPTVEAKMLSVDEASVANMPGVVQVVVDVPAGFAGVVAKTRQQAVNAARSLAVQWDEGRLWQQADIDALYNFDDAEAGYTIQQEGDAPRVLGSSPTVTADYRTPFAVHAHLEPQAALVDVRADGTVVAIVSTQSHEAVRGDIAAVTGLDEANIEVTSAYLGGGFGRRLNIEAAQEAARLSQAVGAPVHVGWTRPEDMRHGYFRPPTRSQLSGTVENGRITAVNHNHSSAEVAFASLPGFLHTIMGTDFGSWRGSFNFYDGIPNRQLTSWRPTLPVRTGWWRGLGLLANVFATESFMDELAHAAGADPLQFRLDHLGTDAFGARMAGVLRAAAGKAVWGEAVTPGRALGIACAPDVDTCVAHVAEVSYDAESGQIRVHKVVCAVDAGLFINPDGAIAQTEGNITMGLSSVLIEEMQVKDGVIDVDNFGNYPLITMDMAPEIEVILLESDGKPRGMGEPPMGPIGAAVGNAFFALTGVRLRQLPFKPEYVKAQF
ncbi:MAG: molybdopterin-dependent oxidoreductase [Chloroflexi bacterium]|nr:molybdopterin-dependent oxidoreductase [Chloroflexota bacterium]